MVCLSFNANRQRPILKPHWKWEVVRPQINLHWKRLPFVSSGNLNKLLSISRANAGWGTEVAGSCLIRKRQPARIQDRRGMHETLSSVHTQPIITAFPQSPSCGYSSTFFKIQACEWFELMQDLIFITYFLLIGEEIGGYPDKLKLLMV